MQALFREQYLARLPGQFETELEVLDAPGLDQVCVSRFGQSPVEPIDRRGKIFDQPADVTHGALRSAALRVRENGAQRD